MPDDLLSPDGRWRIQWVCTKDTSSYFESDTRYEARVINCASGKSLRIFVRSEFANAEGSHESGVSHFEFLPAGKTLRATFENGQVEDVRLPVKDAWRKRLL